MCDFPVELLVKQTIRSVAFDPTTMGALTSKIQSFHANANAPAFRVMPPDTAFYNLLKCPDTVKYLFEHPRDYMHKIFENDSYKQSLALAKTDNELKDIKNQILYKFIKELKDCRTQTAVEWAAFQHYMLYVYRKFVTANPETSNEPIPSVLIKKLYEHSISLTYEDKFQFFIRLVTLLREYVTMARENFDNLNSKVDPLMYIQCLLNYYNAFCSAANRVTSLFSHFDHFLNEHFNMSWFRLHQKLFFKFFYTMKSVQNKLAIVNQLPETDIPESKELLSGFKNFANDMIMLDKVWDREMKKLTNTCTVPDEKLQKEVTRIMKTNFWITRTWDNSCNKDSQPCLELVPVFPSIIDDMKHFAERLIRTDGTCICEDCMFAKFDHNVMNNLKQKDKDRIILCYVCNESVNLENLGTHLVQEIGEMSRNDALKIFKWQGTTPSIKKMAKKPSSKLCKILSDTVVKKDANLFKLNDDCFNRKGENSLLKEPLSKRLLECPARDTESIVRLTNDYGKCPKSPSKSEKEPSIKIASEPPLFKASAFADGSTNKTSSKSTQKSNDKKEKEGYTLKFNVNNLSRTQGKLPDPKLSTFLGNAKSPSGTTKLTENCVGHACGHKCKKEESAANGATAKNLPNGTDTTESVRDKKCDCAYCEVFGTNVPTHAHKTNETRDRLRNRLTRRKERINEVLKNKSAVATHSPVLRSKVDTAKPAPVQQPKLETLLPQPVVKQVTPVTTETKPVEKSKDKSDDDLDRILDFIQGKPIDKVALAEKKAAKKARQKQKKEEERLKKEAEEEEKRLEEQRKLEEKRKEEERLKALALKQNAAQTKKVNKKAKSNKAEEKKPKSPKRDAKEELMEETIPAMVTIKRVVENNSTLPTVTITLKGSTPDQDKLLYTLVNGHASDYSSAEEKTEKKKDKRKPEQTKNEPVQINQPKKSNNKKSNTKVNKNTNGKVAENNKVTTKELKVTLTVDKSFHKGKEVIENIKKSKQKNNKPKETQPKKSETKVSNNNSNENPVEIDIPSLKLPPGITITKVSGPLTNKTCNSSSSSSSSSSSYQNVPVNKSGVIVVDTEKLIQQQSVTSPNSKKNKKKKKKNSPEEKPKNSDTKSNMVTLRNPIFHTLQTKMVEKTEPVVPCNEQASITKGENGMVTIRRPSYMNPIDYGKETPISEYLGNLKPVMNYELPPKKEGEVKTNGTIDCNGIKSDTYDIDRSRLSTHDILWGLPGIEITKVNKNAVSNDVDNKKSCQAADVSIIPTSSNNGEKFNLDRDDWPFESVFAPKDILEDDLDADERELEAFKRFCQQSIPPKHKEKVAHLNVKDIVLKKKNDVTYS